MKRETSRCSLSLLSVVLTLSLLLVGMTGCDVAGDGDGDGPTYDPNALVINTDITSPTTWLGDKVYIIDGSIEVTSTLTIPAGTVVKFAPYSGLQTSGGGVIDASGGTALLPIVFTSVKDDAHGGDTNMDGSASSPAKKDWYDIAIAEANGSSFNYCEFSYGGGWYDDTLEIDAVIGTVTNCVFAHNDGATYGALDLGSALAGTTVTGNRFYDNVVPLRVNTTFDVDDSNYFSDLGGTVFNTRNGIFVSTGPVDGSISWHETEVAYVIIDEYLDVNMGNFLNLGSNVVLKFSSGMGLEWHGDNLNNYNGTGVAYTSYKDDSRKGDTNGDGSATTPAAGDWDGVYNTVAVDYESWIGWIFYNTN